MRLRPLDTVLRRPLLLGVVRNLRLRRRLRLRAVPAGCSPGCPASTDHRGHECQRQ